MSVKINVGVMGANASGEVDLVLYQIECSQEQIDAGEHYDMAKDRASADGHEPAIAFDEKDPAWKHFGVNPAYRDFFQKLAVNLQDTFVNRGNEPSGADVIEHLSGAIGDFLLRDEINEQFHLVFDSAAGRLLDVYLPEGDDLAYWRAAGAMIVAVDIHAAYARPSLSNYDLETAAKSLMKRSAKYGFSVDSTNVGDLMREELALNDFEELPAEFGPVLVAAQAAYVDKQAQSSTNTDRPRG
ncbi:MAG TPA: hypothetical protein DDZ88_05105 [Verrucomicrobiales bacterium]|nr:hypothetical protein [Verrucomicrobiales bacterium]